MYVYASVILVVGLVLTLFIVRTIFFNTFSRAFAVHVHVCGVILS